MAGCGCFCLHRFWGCGSTISLGNYSMGETAKFFNDRAKGILMLRPLSNDRYRVDTENLEEYEWMQEIPGVELLRSTAECIEAIVLPRNVLGISGMLPPNCSPLVPTEPSARVTYCKLSGDLPFQPPFTLRDYQKEAVEFCTARTASALFHDLGMGKTAMALASLEPPALVVCPSTAIYGWKSSAEAWGMKTQVLQGNSTGRQNTIRRDADLYLTTFGSSAQWVPLFRGGLGHGPYLHTMIFDEAHNLHKVSLQATKACAAVRRRRTISMTATPLRNRMPSLWGILNATAPKAWGTKHHFLERYAGASPGEYGGQVLGFLTNEEELASRLSEFAIRRSLEEPEFRPIRPRLERERITIKLDIQQRKALFSEARKSAVSKYTRGNLNPTQLRYLSAQRQLMGRAKLEWLEAHKEIVYDECKAARRILWWFWFREHADRFVSLLDGLGVPVDVIHGGTTAKARSRILEQWEHGDPEEPRILVGTIGSLNAAANLLTCRTAVFVEVDWAPINIVQAEKRHHRPGSKFPVVSAYYLVVEDSIDEDIAERLLEKVEEAEHIFGRSGQIEQMNSILLDPTLTSNVLVTQ